MLVGLALLVLEFGILDVLQVSIVCCPIIDNRLTQLVVLSLLPTVPYTAFSKMNSLQKMMPCRAFLLFSIVCGKSCMGQPTGKGFRRCGTTGTRVLGIGQRDCGHVT